MKAPTAATPRERPDGASLSSCCCGHHFKFRHAVRSQDVLNRGLSARNEMLQLIAQCDVSLADPHGDRKCERNSGGINLWSNRRQNNAAAISACEVARLRTPHNCRVHLALGHGPHNGIRVRTRGVECNNRRLHSASCESIPRGSVLFGQSLHADLHGVQRRVIERKISQVALPAGHEYESRAVIGSGRQNWLVVDWNPHEQVTTRLAQILAHESPTHALRFVLQLGVHIVRQQFCDLVFETLLVPIRKRQIVRIGAHLQFARMGRQRIKQQYQPNYLREVKTHTASLPWWCTWANLAWLRQSPRPQTGPVDPVLPPQLLLPSRPRQTEQRCTAFHRVPGS